MTKTLTAAEAVLIEQALLSFGPYMIGAERVQAAHILVTLWRLVEK